MDIAAFHSDITSLLAFASTYAAMLVTPGPSFAVVSQASVSASGREVAQVVFGIACGASLLIMLVLGGAANLPIYENSEWMGRYAGIVILLIIGFRTLQSAVMSAVTTEPGVARSSRRGHFVLGLVTAFTNPISFAFFSSVALSSQIPNPFTAARLFPLGVFVMALCWFGLIAILLTLPAIKKFYGRATRQLTGLMGAILIITALSWLTVPA